MELKIIVPFEKLNASYIHKPVSCQGIVKQLSVGYKDEDYGYIQSIIIQELKKSAQEVGVQNDLEVVLLEDDCGFLNPGDKVQVTGALEVMNAINFKASRTVLIAKHIEKIDDYKDITPQDISLFKNAWSSPLVQQDLADSIFENILNDNDIKLMGTLLLFCTDSPSLLEQRIHGNLSFLLAGPSETYKTSFLQTLKNLLPNDVFHFKQKSEERFITYNSRYKIGGEYYKIAGLADFAKDGLILIDNLEYLKKHRLYKLDENFTKILDKTSLIAATHAEIWRNNAYESLKFPQKINLLKKFDITLFANKISDKKLDIKILGKDFKKILSKDLLNKYIIFAKKNYDPLLTVDACEHIKNFIDEMIKINKKKKKDRKINKDKSARVIFMLSKAYVRIALRNDISISDVKRILEIYKKSLRNLGLI